MTSMKQILLQKYINPYISIYYDKTCINIMDWYDHNNDICIKYGDINTVNDNNIENFSLYSNFHLIKFLHNSKFKLSNFYIVNATENDDIDMFCWCYDNILKPYEDIEDSPYWNNYEKYLSFTIILAINNDNDDILCLIDKYFDCYLFHENIENKILDTITDAISLTSNLNVFKWILSFVEGSNNEDLLEDYFDDILNFNDSEEIVEWFTPLKI